MHYQYNDGGRAAAGMGAPKNDCVTRAICIVSGLPYAQVWRELAALNGNGTADRCIQAYREWFDDWMRAHGFSYVVPNSKRYVRDLGASDLPAGNYIVDVARHYFAVKGDTIHDTHPVGDRKVVRGFWLYTAPVVPNQFNVMLGDRQLNRYPLNQLQAITMRNMYRLNYGGNPEIKPISI